MPSSSYVQDIKNLRAAFHLSLVEAKGIVDGEYHEVVGTYDNPLTGDWQRVVDKYPVGVWWHDENDSSLHYFNGKGNSPVWYDENEARRKGLI